jgi:hypothetical protein
MDAYENTLFECRTSTAPPGRDSTFEPDPSINPDLANCRQAFSDAHMMRSFDADNYLVSLLDGYDWKVSVAGRSQSITMHLARNRPVPLPDGQDHLEQIDWQRSADPQHTNLPRALLADWRRFHQGIVRGNMDQINTRNPDANGLRILAGTDPNDASGRTYLKVIRSHNNAKRAIGKVVNHLANSC